MKVDLYDFDQTIFPYDSGTLFTLHCLIWYPWCMVMLPLMCAGGILLACHLINFSTFKRFCFLYTRLLPLERAVKRFWDKYEDKIYPWFRARPRAAIVISASPEFLLREIQQRLGIEKLIATRYTTGGVIIGKNCRDEEKVRRLFGEYAPEELEIIDVYSDSLRHDRPIFALAQQQCYHIIKGERRPFQYREVFEETV